tara:strand:+ start:212 stop:1726 length:1515 start_codon:yes stop_codon:yes gene_type:complete
MKNNTFLKNFSFSSIIFLIILLLVIISPNQPHGFEYKMYLIGTWSLIIFPITYYFYSSREKNIFPIVCVLLCYFFLTYFLYFFLDLYFFPEKVEGTFYSHQNIRVEDKVYNVESIHLLKSLKVLFYGLLSLNFGYLLKILLEKDSKKSIKSKYFKIKDIRELLFITISLSILTFVFFYIIKIHFYISQFSQIRQPLVYMSTALCTLSFIKIDNLKKYFFLIPVFLFFIVEMLEGSYVFPFMILLFCYFLYVSISKKFLIIPIIILFLIGSFFHSIKYDYRGLNWHQSNIDGQVVQTQKNYIYQLKALLWLSEKKLKKIFSTKNFLSKEIVRDNNIRRLFHSAEALNVVTMLSPDVIDFWNGYSYKILSTKIVPRIFWKNKPSDLVGNEVGKRYRILSPNDSQTSWNLPVLNEFYANFGFKAVIIGMFFIGFILRFIGGLNLFKIDINSFSFVIGSVLLFSITFFEIHLSMLFGAIVQTFIFLILLIICAKFTYSLLEKKIKKYE